MPVVNTARPSAPHDAYTHFKSPLSTLLTSRQHDHNIHSKDLSQAYGLFYAQVQALATLLSSLPSASSTCPAVEYLKPYAADLAACVVRDMRCALEDLITSQEDSLKDASGLVDYNKIISTDLFGGIKDMAALSQHAIKFTGCVFRFPMLASIFSDDDLGTVLSTVLNILRQPILMTPSEQKTRSMAMLALTSAQLPTQVVERHVDALLQLFYTIFAETDPLGRNGCLRGDALMMLHRLLVGYPSLFLRRMLEPYEDILSLLVSETSAFRIRAAYAIAGYAHAVVTSCTIDPPDTVREDSFEEARASIRRRTARFIKSQAQQDKSHHGKQVSLKQLLQAEIPPTPDVEPGPQAGWAYSVLACLTVLTGSTMFLEKDCMLLITGVLPVTGLDHLWVPTRALHSLVWRCLVWNFVWTPYMPRSKLVPRTENWRAEKRQHFADNLKQVQAPGVAAALVSALLYKDEKPFLPSLPTRLPRDTDVVRSIGVVNGLVSIPGTTLFTEGVSILGRLMSGVGYDTAKKWATPWTAEALMPTDLLRGALIESDRKNILRLMQPYSTFQYDAIRALADTEVEAHWEELLNAWLLAFKRVATDDKLVHLKSDLLHIWQALLLAQVKLTPSFAHFLATPDHSDRTLQIITDLLLEPDQQEESSARLCAAKQLWAVMKLVFSAQWLSETSKTLLKHLLIDVRFARLRQMREAWNELCCDLVTAADPTFLGSLDEDASDERQKQTLRELWFSAAPWWERKDPQAPWMSFLGFLLVPFASWSLTESEQEIWTFSLDFAISCAAKDGAIVNTVLEEVAKYLSEDSPVPSFLLLSLLKRLQPDDAVNIPSTLLRLTNEYLRTYPAQAQDIYPAMTIISALSQTIRACAPSAVVPVLKSMQPGLCTWLLARPSWVPDKEYDQYLTSLYSTSLEALRAATSSIQVLHDLEDFFCATFTNVRTTAIGPFAFKSYWDDVSGSLKFKDDEFPPDLRIVLGAFYSTFAPAEMPSFLAGDSQSQSVGQNASQLLIIPDSQPMEDEVEDDYALFAQGRLGQAGVILPAKASLHTAATLQCNEAERSEVPASEHILTPKAPSLSCIGNEERPSLSRKRPAQPKDDTHSNKRARITTERERVEDSPADKKIVRMADDSGHFTEIAESDSTPSSSPADSPRNPTRLLFDGVEVSPLRDIRNRRSRLGSPVPDHSLPSPPFSLDVPVCDYRAAPAERVSAHSAHLEDADEVGSQATVEDDFEYGVVNSSHANEHELVIPLLSPPRARGRQALRKPESPTATLSASNDCRPASNDSPSSRKGGLSRSPSKSAAMETFMDAHNAMLNALSDPAFSAVEMMAALDLLHEMNGKLNEQLRKRIVTKPEV